MSPIGGKNGYRVELSQCLLVTQSDIEPCKTVGKIGRPGGFV